VEYLSTQIFVYHPCSLCTCTFSCNQPCRQRYWRNTEHNISHCNQCKF